MKKIILLWIAAISLLLLAIIVVSNQSQLGPNPVGISMSSGPAPDFLLSSLTGDRVSLESLKGKKVLLTFWATWCKPCVAELPHLEDLYQQTLGNNLVILAVNVGQTRQTVERFIKENGFSFQVLLDQDRALTTRLGIRSIPASVFLDEEHNVVVSRTGYLSIEELQSYLTAMATNP